MQDMEEKTTRIFLIPWTHVRKGDFAVRDGPVLSMVTVVLSECRKCLLVMYSAMEGKIG